MITLRDIVRALQSRRNTEWVVIERTQELGVADEARGLRRRERRTRTTLVVHHDMTRGRGSARVEISAGDGDANALVEQAVSLASTAIAPTWKSVPPAAPAKVLVLDPELAKVDLVGAAAAITRAIRRDGASVSAAATILREQIAVHASSGFHEEWSASLVRVDALVTVGDRSLELVREERRGHELSVDMNTAVAEAVADLKQLAIARAPVAGRCALVLTGDALLHGSDLGVWSVFAAQADAVVERQGLTRYRLHTPIAPDADKVYEPLTITSNGAIDFATRSSPVGDDGDAVRQFPLVERGVSVGLGHSAPD